MKLFKNTLKKLMNVSERKGKRRSKKIEEYEKKYHLTLENANDIITILNQNFEFEYINEEMAINLIGQKEGDLIGKNVSEVLHPDDLTKAYAALRNGFKAGEGKEEVRVRHKNGHWIWVDVKGKIFKDKKGEKKALLIARDITEKKIAEQRLMESEEKYRLITENIYDLIAVFNNQYKFEYINELVHEEILGYKKGDLIGQSALFMIHPEDFKETIKKWRSGIKFGEGTTELRFRKKDGNYVWLEIRGRQFRDNDETIKTIVISRDITRRRISEQELKKSEEKYREAYNLVNFYKELFAHDMNNILQGILSTVDYYSISHRELEEQREREDIFEIIKKHVRRASSLISKVRKLSQLEDTEINLIPIAIHNVLNKSVENTKNSFYEKRITLRIEGLSKDLKVLGDELLIDVFDNLLNNAVKFNDNDKEIIVEILLSKIQADDINYVKFEFKDYGIGIQDDRKGIIFKKLYERDISKRGMGIGLSLVKKIVDKYNGKIWVEDRIKGDYTKGCNFILLLQEK